MGLEPVVSPAQRGEVAGAGRPAPAARSDVVVVAGASGSGAPGEDAGAVAEVDWFLDALGHRVGVGVCAGVEVEDRSHGDLCVSGRPHHDLTCWTDTRALPRSSLATGSVPARAASVRWCRGRRAEVALSATRLR